MVERLPVMVDCFYQTRHRAAALWLSLCLAIAVLGVAQLEASHYHSDLDYDVVECQLHASGFSLVAALNHSALGYELAFTSVLFFVVATLRSSSVYTHYRSRAPPVFS